MFRQTIVEISIHGCPRVKRSPPLVMKNQLVFAAPENPVLARGLPNTPVVLGGLQYVTIGPSSSMMMFITKKIEKQIQTV
jgi:hypothetical protein